MEDRKVKEIEHSRRRREVLQGFERLSDTHGASQAGDLESLIKDKEQFKHLFSNMKFYAITEKSERYKQDWLRARCDSKSTVLDFACGSGENALYAASCGAKAIGVDISPEGIENARRNAAKMGLSDKCEFQVMDGENMLFADSYFDLAVEYGALHHVELTVVLGELARVLKPGASMICIEALRHNPFIHFYRKRTPHLRTAWEVEHILGVESLDVMSNYFRVVNARFFHLAALALVPLRKSALFPKLLPIFNRIDDFLLARQALGKFGWIMAIELSDPIKRPATAHLSH